MEEDSTPNGGRDTDRRMAVANESAKDTASAVVEAQKGDTAAFEQLYREHVGRVYAVCLRMTANAVTAEETTQEAFVLAWEKLGSFRKESAFGTWVCRIAINQVLSRQRREHRHVAWRMENTDDVHLSETQSSDHFGGALRSDPALKMDLESAIAALPEGARTVFVMHDIEGYRHEEIADAAGIAVGTSKAHLHRARYLLREMLER